MEDSALKTCTDQVLVEPVRREPEARGVDVGLRRRRDRGAEVTGCREGSLNDGGMFVYVRPRGEPRTSSSSHARGEEKEQFRIRFP